MRAYELIRAIYGDEADLVALPHALERSRVLNIPILRPGVQLRPIWAWKLTDADSLAARLEIRLDEPGFPDDLVVQHELRPVTYGELRKRRE